MSGRSHFAAPLLLAIVVALILYVSLFPFRFDGADLTLAEAARTLAWARASRGDMLNNLLLYVPLGFCLALLVEPRAGRTAALATSVAGGSLLSLAMELTQASIESRVPSLTDLSLNTAGAFVGGIVGSAWQVLGARMTPQANPRGRSGAVAVTVLVLWLLARLWPLVPDVGLGQLKRAVRPLFSPDIAVAKLAAFLVGWLVVAQAVFHLARRQRSVDGFLIVIAIVLIGRAITAGNALEAAELAAIALLLPVLVLISRLEDRGRSAFIAAALGTWLVAVAVVPLLGGSSPAGVEIPDLGDYLSRNAPPPAELAGKGFSYVALGWLLAGAGLPPAVAAGVTVLVVVLLSLLQAGAAAPLYGWIDVILAMLAGAVVWRWMPKTGGR